MRLVMAALAAQGRSSSALAIYERKGELAGAARARAVSGASVNTVAHFGQTIGSLLRS